MKRRVLTIDFESRSTVDLRTQGAYVYAAHPTTEILCLAFIYDEGDGNIERGLWVPPELRDLTCYGYGYIELKDGSLVDIISDEKFIEYMLKIMDDEQGIIEAHVAEFEFAMWENIMVKKYKFPPLPLDRVQCSAAKAAVHAIPRSLGKACYAMRLDEQKDSEGRKIMLKMCKPRKARNEDKDRYYCWDEMTFWHEEEKDFEKLYAYCVQDVISEHALSSCLPDLSAFERRIWIIDQQINNRGVKIDIDSVMLLTERVKEQERLWLKEANGLTDGWCNPRQVAAALAWMGCNNVDAKNLQKKTVDDLLKKDLPDNVRKFLEIRQALGKSSTSKLKKMVKMSGEDYRVRGLFLYSGARTKRWTGRGIQPQNLPRDSFGDQDIEEILSTKDYDIRYMLYGDDVSIASRCIRGMFIPEKGKKLFCADFSAIEARVLAWVAREEKVLKDFIYGKQLYESSAARIYKVPYESVTSEQRFIGKVAELSLGYQGGVGAFMGMLDKYGVNDIEEHEAKEIIKMWRDSRQRTVELWYGLEKAAMATIRTGDSYRYGMITYEMDDVFLKCILPNGGSIKYAYPRIELVETPYGKERDAITFWGVASDKDKVLAGAKDWGKLSTYGGKLCENVIQAVARELLAETLIRLDNEGYKIVMHVHDEVLCEVESECNNLEEFNNIVAEAPEWADGLPIESKAWEGYRYRK